MKTYENTFIRGPSPTESAEATPADNINSAANLTMALNEAEHHQSKNNPLNGNGQYFTAYDEATYVANYEPTLRQGRKTFAFWTVVTLLLVLTVGNLILTLTIIGVLRLGKGIQGMELIPEEDVVKFVGEADLDRIYSKTNGQIDGFSEQPVSITGDGADVIVKMQRNGQSYNRLIMDSVGVNFKGINTFELKDPRSGAVIFNTHRPHYNIPRGAENLVVKSVSANRLTSPIGQPLTLHTDNRINVKGSEGITMDASSLLLEVEHNIALNTTHGATHLEAGGGIYLDMQKMPSVSSEFGIRTGSVQYKLCVCMPHGTLFRIAIPRIHNGPKITCVHFSAKHDPCAVN